MPQAFYSHTSGPPPGDGFEWSVDSLTHELPAGQTFTTPDLGVTYGNFTHWSTFIDAGYLDANGVALQQSGYIDREAWWGSPGSTNPEVNLGFTATPAGGVETLAFDLVWAQLVQPAPDTLRVRVYDYVTVPGGRKREATLEFNLPDIFVANIYFHGRAGRVELDFRNLFDDLSHEPFTQIEDIWVELDSIADFFGPPMGIFAIDNVSINGATAPEWDYNRDGIVDAADYVVWRKTDGSQAEFDTWRANFGASLGPGSGSALPSAQPLSAAVPESSTLILMILAPVGECLCPRRGDRKFRQLINA
jgi:hypothetical protein